MDRINAFKAACTALLGALTSLWGWMGWLVVLWIFLMLLDYLTGSGAALKEGKWSSKVAREGIWHKAGMVIVVVIAALADLLIALVLGHLPVVALPIEYSGLICPLVLVWYCLTELGSVGENAIRMGADVPAWLPKLFAASKEAVDTAGEHIEAVVEEKEG